VYTLANISGNILSNMLTWAMLAVCIQTATVRQHVGQLVTGCFTQQPFFAGGCHFVYITLLQVDHVIYDPFLIGQNSATSLASRQQN
jgi:hypothetical protein